MVYAGGDSSSYVVRSHNGVIDVKIDGLVFDVGALFSVKLDTNDDKKFDVYLSDTIRSVQRSRISESSTISDTASYLRGCDVVLLNSQIGDIKATARVVPDKFGKMNTPVTLDSDSVLRDIEQISVYGDSVARAAGHINRVGYETIFELMDNSHADSVLDSAMYFVKLLRIS